MGLRVGLVCPLRNLHAHGVGVTGPRRPGDATNPRAGDATRMGRTRLVKALLAQGKEVLDVDVELNTNSLANRIHDGTL